MSGPAVDHDHVGEVLTPRGRHCRKIDGWGDLRLRCGETEISFSGEYVGWRVSFEGPMSAAGAEEFVATVAAQVAQEEPVEWIQVG